MLDTAAANQMLAATQSYLDIHFCTQEEMAERAGISTSQIGQLIDAGTAPKPSYTVAGGTLSSAAFGEISISGLRDGHYFRSAAAPWLVRAARHGPEGSSAFLAYFREELAAHLEDANASVMRLPDAFDEAGKAIVDGLSKRLDAMVSAYSSGVFSICIAKVEHAAGIVRKEILQEKLQVLFDSPDLAVTGSQRNDILRDIDAYAEACMPFTPVEYPISSRKRLLEDLPQRLAT